MSKYSQKEQANIIGIAAELETVIITEKEELQKIRSEQLKLPDAPKMKDIEQPHYVKKVIPNNKQELFSKWASENCGFFRFLFEYNCLPIRLIIIISLPAGVLLSIFLVFVGVFLSTSYFVIIAIVVFFFHLAVFLWALIFNMNRQADFFTSNTWATYITQATNAANKKIYNDYLVRYQAAVQKYNEEVNHYNKNVLPASQNEFAKWHKNHNAKLAFLENDLRENQEALNTLYANTQLIPSTYRTVERLTWLYEDMSTSEHDIERSIDLLNTKEIKEELINIQGHVDDMRRDLREGFIGIYSAIQDGNAIQSDILTNLDSIRRSAKIGNYMNVGNLLQNHSRNKTLLQINSKI